MIDAVIAQLKSNCPSLKKITGPVADDVLERADLPTAIIYPTADALGGEYSGATMLKSRIAVEILSELPALETAKREIRTALNGFKPAGVATPFSFGGGRLEKIDGARLAWVDSWDYKTCL